MLGPPSPVSAPARRRRTGPGRGPRFVCAGPARASAGTHRPRQPPERPDPPPGSERGELGVCARRGGPWAPPVPGPAPGPSPLSGAGAAGRGARGGMGLRRPEPAPLSAGPGGPPAAGGPSAPAERGLRPRESGHPPSAPAAPGVPHPRGVAMRQSGTTLPGWGCCGLRAGGGLPRREPPGCPALFAPPGLGTPCCGHRDPAGSRPCCSQHRSPQAASPHCHPDSPSAHPHFPAPPGHHGAGRARDPLFPPPGACAIHKGDATGTLGCSLLGSAGCMVLSGQGAYRAPSTLPACSHPQPGCMPLTIRVPDLGTGLRVP